MRKEVVIFLGSSGFPFGSATIQRQIQLAKSLIEAGFGVIVLNKRGAHSKFITGREKITTHNYFQGIEYLYSSIITFRPKSFVTRNTFKFIGIFLQFFAILYFRLFKNAKYIFNNSVNLKDLKYHYFLSQIFGMELIYDYVELVSTLGKRGKNNFESVNSSFDIEFVKYTDKLIVISSFIEEYINKVDPNKPKVKIPPIIDFSFSDGIEPEMDIDAFFLFCASIAYEDVIRFIIEVFIGSRAIEKGFQLKLVINGSEEELKILNDFILQKKANQNIKVLSKLTYTDLIYQYKTARALLIPISNNLQDQARFPFKICEYTASKRPIITSDSGAITEFFENEFTAFIAKTEDSADFIQKLNLVISEPRLADRVGLNGYSLGKNYFNYNKYNEILKNLLHDGK